MQSSSSNSSPDSQARPRSPLVVRKPIVRAEALAAFAATEPQQQQQSVVSPRGLRRVLSSSPNLTAATDPSPPLQPQGSPPPLFRSQRTSSHGSGTLRRSFWKRLSGSGGSASAPNACALSPTTTPPPLALPHSRTSVGDADGALFALSQAGNRPPPTLEDTLSDPQLSLAFFRHLKAQQAAENLTFLLEHARLEGLDAGAADERTAARQLFNRYFATGGERELNVSKDVRDRLHRALFATETPPADGCGRWADAFEEVRSEIVAMLDPVLHPQWVATGEWRFLPNAGRIADRPPTLDVALRTPRLLHSFKAHLPEERLPLLDFIAQAETFLAHPTVSEARRLLSDFEGVLPCAIDPFGNPLAVVKDAVACVRGQLSKDFGAWLEVRSAVWAHRRSRALAKSWSPSLCDAIASSELLSMLQSYLEIDSDSEGLAMLAFLCEAGKFSMRAPAAGEADSPTDLRRLKAEAQRIAETFLTPLRGQLVSAVPQGVRQSTLVACGLGNSDEHKPVLTSKIFSKPIAHVFRMFEISRFRQFLDTFCWVNVDFAQDPQQSLNLEHALDLQRSPRP